MRLFVFILLFFFFMSCSRKLTPDTAGITDYIAFKNGSNTAASENLQPDPTFKGPYPAITNKNYDPDFKGTTAIIDIKNAMTNGDQSGKSWGIKAVITGLTVFNGSVSTRSIWIQDCTAGIYLYLGADLPVNAGNLGAVITGTVTTVKSYYGVIEITAFSGTAVITTNGAPAAIYVKDITNASLSNDSMVVRYVGRVSDNTSGNVSFVQPVPMIYGIASGDSLDFSIGDVVTVIGPQTQHNGIPQIATKSAYPMDDATYCYKQSQ